MKNKIEIIQESEGKNKARELLMNIFHMDLCGSLLYL